MAGVSCHGQEASLAACTFQTPGPECVAGIKGAGVRCDYSLAQTHKNQKTTTRKCAFIR